MSTAPRNPVSSEPLADSATAENAAHEVDLVILGGGGAGLSLILQLEQACNDLGLDASALQRMSILLIDPIRRHAADRTWCFWDDPSSDHHFHAIEPTIYRQWRHAEVLDQAAQRIDLELGALRYAMVRSQDFYPVAYAAAERLGIEHWQVRGRVTASNVAGRGEVSTADGRTVRARWVIDSRPRPADRAGLTDLVLHFRGWTVDFGSDMPSQLLDESTVTIMDFSTPQPADGISFMYCLPLGEGRALVEYNEFSPARIPDEAYDVALRTHFAERYGTHAETMRIEAVEDDALPLTDALFRPHAGGDSRVWRIGAAGGASRGSSGYAFAAIQRQTSVVARALLQGRDPVVPSGYSPRHRWMDALLLRVLAEGGLDRAELFLDLFRGVPGDRMLRFLDGQSSLGEEISIMLKAPQWRMIRAGAADSFARLGRRWTGASRPPSS